MDGRDGKGQKCSGLKVGQMKFIDELLSNLVLHKKELVNHVSQQNGNRLFCSSNCSIQGLCFIPQPPFLSFSFQVFPVRKNGQIHTNW